ncbi:MAG: ATPase domain-containing protein [Candidatus Woesearchaeota archaeon]
MASIFKIGLRGDELEEKLGGGIPKNSIGLIEGKNGFGKSILSQRITYGAVANKETITYISTEMSVSGFMNQMDSLKYEIKEAFMKKRLKFVSLFPSIGGFEYKDNLIEDLMKAKELFESDIIILDTLGEFVIRNGLTQKDCFKLLTFFNKIASQGKTVIFTADPDNIDENLIKILRMNSSIYILMDQKEQYGVKLNVMKVIRYTGAQSDVDKEMPFKVRAGIGIVIELAS